MSYSLNLQLKDGIQPEKLLEFGFIPKYDEDTGEIKEYYRMSGFNWNSIATTKCMQLLYDLFVNGIVEPTKKAVETE